MKILGTANVNIKVKDINLNLGKKEYDIDDISNIINKVGEIPMKIGCIIDKLYQEGHILWKRDTAVIRQFLIDRGIIKKISYESFARFLSSYTNLPEDKLAKADNLADVIFQGKYPNWKISSCNNKEEELRLKKTAIRFDELSRDILLNVSI